MVAEMVDKCRILADIGTDHGYLPIYLIKNNIIKKAIAADISKGSCDKAYRNAVLYNMDDLIDVRCGNGLEIIKDTEIADCIVIAGTGGLLAINILKSNEEAVKRASQLILQPQRDIDKVRRYIHSVGFKITNEKMIKEKGKYYTVIKAVKGNETYNLLENYFGRILIERKSAILREFAAEELNKILKILKKMKDNDKTNNIKYKELTELSQLYEEVLKCL